MKTSNTIDEYIAQYPKEVQLVLEKMRKTIHEVVPEASENISYGIPTFKLNGNLVHFGAFKKHVGFFPGSSGVAAFQKELTQYVTSKGTIQFQLNEPIPYDLIKKITEFRVKEQLKKNKL